MLNERDLRPGTRVDTPTLKELWTEWYEIGSQSVKPGTRDQYIWRLDHRVSARLAATKVKDITPLMLMDEIRRLSDSGLSPSTVQGVRRIIVNPMTAVRAPRSAPSTRATAVNLTADQARQLYICALHHRDVTASTVILLGLKFGLRHGEILGLRLSDIDLDTGC